MSGEPGETQPQPKPGEHPLQTRFKEIVGQSKTAEVAVKAGYDRLHGRPDYESLTVETLEELERINNQSENLKSLLTDSEWIHVLMIMELSPDMIVTALDKKEELHSQNKEKGA